MTPDRWQQIREIYFAVSDAEPEQREELLAKLTAHDPGLRREVEALLDAPVEGEAALDHAPFADSPLPFPASSTLLAGDILANRFEVLSHLGSGGMGEVYEAEDRDLKSRVALKVIRREVASNPQALARFRKEISLARKVTHRSVCRVYDFFPSASSSRGTTVDFLTMELLSGETLSRYLLREGPLSLPQAIPILTQIAAGLDAAHTANVLHRDLKGSNIILTQDSQGLRAVITDFGLARSHMPDGSAQTSSLHAAGTPLYMSPEQLEGHELTPASDLYSLGVLMYEMATGIPPYQGQSPIQVVIKRVKEDRPPAPSSIQKDIDPRWESTILRCLSYNPSERYANATELINALGGPYVPPALRQAKRKPVLIAALAVVLAIAASLWYRNNVPPISPEAARWYAEGLIALNNSSFARSAKLLERAVELAPDSVSIHCRLAEAYVELDRRDNAQEQLLAALADHPRSSDESLLREGTQAMLAGKWDQALALAEKRAAAATSSEATTAQLDRARWLERAYQPLAAIKIYEELLAKDPSQPGALLRLAALEVGRNQPAAALPLLERARTAYEAQSNTEGLGEVALARARLAPNIPDALVLLDQADQYATQSSSASLSVRAKLFRADRIHRQGQLELSRDLTREAIRLAESSGLYAEAMNGHQFLALIPFSENKLDAAEVAFKDLLTLAVRYRTKRAEANARFYIALSYINSERGNLAFPYLDQAEAFYQSAGLLPQIAQLTSVRGEALQRVGRYDEAAKTLEKALSITKLPAQIRRTRERQAELATIRNRYDEAEAIYSTLIRESEPTGNRLAVQDYKLKRADALINGGNFGDARKEIEAVIAEGAKTPRVGWEVERILAKLEYQQGRFKPAVTRLEQLLAKDIQQGNLILARDVRTYLCAYYVHSEEPNKGIPTCLSLLPDFSGRAADLLTFHQALAQMYSMRGEVPKALEQAQLGLKYSEELKNASEVWYSLQVLALVQHKAKIPDWRSTRDRANQAMREYEKQIGPQALKTFLGRAGTRQLWQSVEQLQ